MSTPILTQPLIDWNSEDGTVAGMLRDFREHDTTPDDINIIVAWYNPTSYDGYAFVVYRDRRDGQVYEVNGSHCSCYGLDGQWAPELVSIPEILQRPSYVDCWGREDENTDIRAALTAALT